MELSKLDRYIEAQEKIDAIKANQALSEDEKTVMIEEITFDVNPPPDPSAPNEEWEDWKQREFELAGWGTN